MNQLAPTFYYPLIENPPCWTANRLTVPALRESRVLFPFLDSLREAPVWVRDLGHVYDPQRGFFHIDPVDPHIGMGLADLAKNLFILRTYGFLDHLDEYIPDYSPDDIDHWLLRSVFAGAKNPFRKKSIYRYRDSSFEPVMEMVYAARGISERMACEDIASTLAILHLLGRFQGVAGFCDPAILGRAFVALQGADGLIRPSLDPNPVDRCPGDTALHALVAMKLLAVYFGIDAMEELRVQDLANGLASLANEALRRTLDPDSLHTLYGLSASLSLLSDSVPSSSNLFERIEDAMMSSLGLLALWKEYKTENPRNLDGFFAGLEFVSSLATSDRALFLRLIRDFPAGKTAEAGWFSLFPIVATFSALRAAGGVGVLFGILSERLTEMSRLYWRFDWNSLTLPFVLRHYPLIEADEAPLLWFRGERDVVLSLRNMSAASVSRLVGDVESVHKRNESVVSSTSSGKEIRVKLKALKTSRNLAVGSVSALTLRLDASWRYPRYPKLPFPALVLRCRYGDRDWELRTKELIIQVLPRRARVTAIVSRESTKARYDPVWTMRAIKGCLRDGGIIVANEVLAKRLYREFLPSSVEDWIQQFEPEVRPAILKLYRALRYYSIEETRECLTAVLRSLPREIVRHAAFVGLGKHLAKSGTHLLYFVKHAYREIFPGVKSEEVTMRFQPFAVQEAAAKGGKLQVGAVILVDDFFGSGKTATDDLSRLAKTRPRLWMLPRYYIAVTGFERGLQRIIKTFPELKQNILTGGLLLTEQDRAFVWPSLIFSDQKELRQAKRVCTSLGEALLRKQMSSERERRKHALGWDGDQALIAFEHNTPNNTLPIFWAKGTYLGGEWRPLYRRRE